MAGNETVFTYAAPALKFGPGAADEIGFDLSQLGARRVLVVTDPGVAATGWPQRVAEQMSQFDIETPTPVSCTSTSTRRSAVVGTPSEPLAPLVAVPTTTGTGAESTTVCVLDVLELQVKTGISHAWLRPTMAVVDPLLTVTQPLGVTASAGMDILCHALEGYTARPYDSYDRKAPDERVPYCGANPVADMWSEQALTLLARSFRTAYRDGDEPMIPHGMSVVLTAPEAFRFTYEARPERHEFVADLLWSGADRAGDDAAGEGPEALPSALIALMRDLDIPNGVGGVGYDRSDIDDLVDGAMKQQQRLLTIAPREVTEHDLAGIFERSLELW